MMMVSMMRKVQDGSGHAIQGQKMERLFRIEDLNRFLPQRLFAICRAQAVLLIEDICRKLAYFDILILAERKPSTWWRR